MNDVAALPKLRHDLREIPEHGTATLGRRGGAFRCAVGRDAERFRARPGGKDEKRRPTKLAGHFMSLECAKEVHAATNAELAGERFEGDSIGTVADEPEAEGWMRVGHQRECANEDVHSFIGNERCHGENIWRLRLTPWGLRVISELVRIHAVGYYIGRAAGQDGPCRGGDVEKRP